MPSLFERFRQRKLVQWTAAYAAAAAAIISLLSAFADPWQISPGMERALQVLVLAGVPVSAVLAWYHGEKGRQRVAPAELALLLGIMAVGGGFIAVTSPSPLELAGPGPAEGEARRVTLAILPPELSPALTRDTAGFSYLLQHLLSEELLGRRGIALKDPLSFNSRLAGANAADIPFQDARVEYAVRIVVTPAAGGVDVAVLLTKAATEDLLGTHRFRSRDDADLPAQFHEAAKEISLAIQEESDLPATLDLEPWLEHSPRNVEATRAFLQGAAYTYRSIPGGGKYFERALEIDPSFIAPRVWLVSAAYEVQDTAAAARHLRVLRELAPRASPFEQAMIGWAEARIAGDTEARARHLTVALDYSPDNNILLYNLASAALELGRVQEAYDAARIAVDSEWSYPPLYSLFGVVSIESGNIDGLRAALEAALEVRPVSPYVYGLLEALCVMDGDSASARRFGRTVRAAVQAGEAPDALHELVPYYGKLADLARQRGNVAAQSRLAAWAASLQ